MAVKVKEVEFQGKEVVVLDRPRLPYSRDLEKRYNVAADRWSTLIDSVWPGAKTVKAVVMALDYCRSQDLDPFLKVVHIVSMWSRAAGGSVETVWPGIALLRTIAFRTNDYAGMDAADFGPDMTVEFTGEVSTYERGKRVGKHQENVTVTFPSWCQHTVYRLDRTGQIRKFVGPRVKWLETYATREGTDLPNEMWQTRPEGQLDKCSEAAALRRAFPEKIGTSYAAEEMEGRVLTGTIMAAAEPVNDAKAAEPPEIPEEDQQVDLEEAIADKVGLTQVGRGYVDWFENARTLEALKQAADTAERDPQVTDNDRILLRPEIKKNKTRIKAGTMPPPEAYAGGMVTSDRPSASSGGDIPDEDEATERESTIVDERAKAVESTTISERAVPPESTMPDERPTVPGVEGGKIIQYRLFKNRIGALYEEASTKEAVDAVYALAAKYLTEFSPNAQRADQEMMYQFNIKRLDAP